MPKILSGQEKRQNDTYLISLCLNLFSLNAMAFFNAGARFTTIIFKIIQTAKANNLNVEKYLEYLITELTKKSTYYSNLFHIQRIYKAYLKKQFSVGLNSSN